jgi:peptidoglycan-associated lipoprotein
LNRVHRFLTPLVLLVSFVALAGCGNKKSQADLSAAETAPAVAASAPTPIAQITATPTLITAGDQVQLSWRTTDANKVTIDGIGDVPTAGVKTVTPTTSTVYTLTAHGDGGSADASVRVTVNAAVSAPPAVVVPTRTMTAEEEFKGGIQDVFFDYDTYDIRADAQAALSKDVAYLVNHPDAKIVIGGYCDERGSNEYNLALGQNRADAAKNALVTAGIAASRIRVVSFGKEKPYCAESTEECWQQNRRGGLVVDK